MRAHSTSHKIRLGGTIHFTRRGILGLAGGVGAGVLVGCSDSQLTMEQSQAQEQEELNERQPSEQEIVDAVLATSGKVPEPLDGETFGEPGAGWNSWNIKDTEAYVSAYVNQLNAWVNAAAKDESWTPSKEAAEVTETASRLTHGDEAAVTAIYGEVMRHGTKFPNHSSDETTASIKMFQGLHTLTVLHKVESVAQGEEVFRLTVGMQGYRQLDDIPGASCGRYTLTFETNNAERLALIKDSMMSGALDRPKHDLDAPRVAGGAIRKLDEDTSGTSPKTLYTVIDATLEHIEMRFPTVGT